MKNIYILSLIWLTLCLQCASPTDKKVPTKKRFRQLQSVYSTDMEARKPVSGNLAALRLDPGIQALDNYIRRNRGRNT